VLNFTARLSSREAVERAEASQRAVQDALQS
jgi:hypothetical protein